LSEGGWIDRSRLIKDEYEVNHSVALLSGTVPCGVLSEYRSRSCRSKIREVNLSSIHEFSSAWKVAAIDPDVSHSV
jgi:hypothetical protein